MIKKARTIIGFLLFAHGLVLGQGPKPLTLEQCHQLAETNYPLTRQYALIEKANEYSVANASKGYLPQVHVGGQAGYQSDVPQIPIRLPNIEIPVPGRDQYRLYGEIAQPITDLFTTKHQKELVRANAEAERQTLKAELYKLKERVNQLYFGVLLVDAQLAQTEILKRDIRSGIAKTEVAIANGVALKSGADVLRVELLKADQRTIELKAARKGHADMLSLFVNRHIDERTHLEKPPAIPLSTEINRPELKLFEARKKTIEVRKQLVDDNALPRFSVFAQAGYGRPGLNMLRNDFATYYIVGARLNWGISRFYTKKQDKLLLSIDQNALDVQKETFLFNTDLALRQQNSEIAKLEELLKTDRDIVLLRENVKLTAQNQLENGTITANDETQLLMAQYRWTVANGQLTVKGISNQNL